MTNINFSSFKQMLRPWRSRHFEYDILHKKHNCDIWFDGIYDVFLAGADSEIAADALGGDEVLAGNCFQRERQELLDDILALGGILVGSTKLLTLQHVDHLLQPVLLHEEGHRRVDVTLTVVAQLQWNQELGHQQVCDNWPVVLRLLGAGIEPLGSHWAENHSQQINLLDQAVFRSHHFHESVSEICTLIAGLLTTDGSQDKAEGE